MTGDERRHVVETVIDQAEAGDPGRRPDGRAEHPRSHRAFRHAQNAGAAVVMVVAPFYEALTLGETLRYLRTVAGAVDIPVMLYNLPPATGSTSTRTLSARSPARSRTSSTSRTPAPT